MEQYKVEITETLSRVVEVNANSNDEAVDIVRQLYGESEIVLDESDYVDTKFNTL
ncbi:DpnD/PcfM family protein [Aerococcaceae bacterium NML160702]|nr:DpnD/PcfM family protein [Aerococcaceae bacterium NML160702]